MVGVHWTSLGPVRGRQWTMILAVLVLVVVQRVVVVQQAVVVVVVVVVRVVPEQVVVVQGKGLAMQCTRPSWQHWRRCKCSPQP